MNSLMLFKHSSEILNSNKNEESIDDKYNLPSMHLGGGTIDVNYSNDTNKLEFDDS
jgi:hypothetical protein